MSGKLSNLNSLLELPDRNQTVDLQASDSTPLPLGIGPRPFTKPKAAPHCLQKTSEHWGKSPLLTWLHQNSFTVFFLFLLGFLGLQFLVPTDTFFLQGQLVVVTLSCSLMIQAVRFQDQNLNLTCMGTMALTILLNSVTLAEAYLEPSFFKTLMGINLLILSSILGTLISVLVYHLWHNDYTGRNALFCACSSYLLIGFLWSCFYCSIAYFSEGAFNDSSSANNAGHPIDLAYHRFFYFSMITLTTVGFGDITPVSPVARSLCWMEAGIGQFYFGFILARLVATQFMTNRTDKGWQHDPNTNAFKTPVPGAKVKQAA